MLNPANKISVKLSAKIIFVVFMALVFFGLEDLEKGKGEKQGQA